MDEISKVWPEWRTVELLGKGAFGSVYKAVKEDFGKSYYAAVKVIDYPQDESERSELESSGMDARSIRNYFEENLQELISEIKVMESLKTAGNIVSIEDYKLVEKTAGFGWQLYIRMELLTSLDSLIVAKGGLSEEETVKLGMDICSALECCEQSHTIHRDIKSGNIFVNKYGDFKLGDFGISKQIERTMSVKSQKGTIMYMAPEIYRGESYDNTVDIYALGITLYRFLNHNRFPFMPPVPQNIRPGDVDKAMTDRIGGKPMPDPINCDAELARIVKKACAFRPEERYLYASDMKKDLEKWKIVKLYGAMNEDTFCGNGSKTESPKQEQKWEQPEREKTTQTEAFSQSYRGFADSVYEETYAAFEKKLDEKAEGPKYEEPKYQEVRYEKPEQEGAVPVNGKDIYVTRNLPPFWVNDEFDVEVNGKTFMVKRPASLKDGMQIRLRGCGEKGMYGGKDGDLYIRIHKEQADFGDIFGGKPHEQESYICPCCKENLRKEADNLWYCKKCEKYSVIQNGKPTGRGLEKHPFWQGLTMIDGLHEKNQYQEELRALQNAEKVTKTSTILYTRLGRAYRLNREYERAEESYNKALQLDSSDGMIYLNVGVLLMSKPNPENEKAKKYLETAINLISEKNSEYPITVANYAIAIGRCGDLEKAAEQLMKAEKLGYKNVLKAREMLGLNGDYIFDNSHSHMFKVNPLKKDTIKEVTIKPRQIVEQKQSPFGLVQNVKTEKGIIAPEGFAGCPKLEKVHLSEGITLICDRAFVNCKNLQIIFIPDSVKEIGKNIVDKPEKKMFGFLSGLKTLKVECHSGSYTERYCKQNEIPYKLV